MTCRGGLRCGDGQGAESAEPGQVGDAVVRGFGETEPQIGELGQACCGELGQSCVGDSVRVQVQAPQSRGARESADADVRNRLRAEVQIAQAGQARQLVDEFVVCRGAPAG